MGWVAGTPATNPAANAELARLAPSDGVQVSVQLLITFRGGAGFDAIVEHIDEFGAVVASHLLPVGFSIFVLPYVGPINLGKNHFLRVKARNAAVGEAQCSIFWKEGAF